MNNEKNEYQALLKSLMTNGKLKIKKRQTEVKIDEIKVLTTSEKRREKNRRIYMKKQAENSVKAPFHILIRQVNNRDIRKFMPKVGKSKSLLVGEYLDQSKKEIIQLKEFDKLTPTQLNKKFNE